MATLLNLPSNAAWWYTHHPAHWQCVDGEWLPDLGQMLAIPGLNRVDKNGDTALTEVHLNKKGVTIIPWEVEPGGYCIQYAGANGPVFLVPDADFINVIIERQERVVSEHQTRAPTHPGSALALPVESKRLDDMRAARERMYTPVKGPKAKA